MRTNSFLISTIFEGVDNDGRSRNRVVAFTSATPEADVSHAVESFARDLAVKTQKRVVIVDARAFHDLQLADAKHVLQHCSQTDICNLLTLPAGEPAGRSSTEKPARLAGWHSTPQVRQAYIKGLRRDFDYVIIDCPSLASSSDVKALAPNIDGVAVVVETNRPRRRRIQTSQHLVESSGAKFLGYILN